MGGRKKRGKNDVDMEVDFHGMTVEAMSRALNHLLKKWRDMACVRVVHGQGTALPPVLHEWCHHRGIAFQLEPGNPGSTLLFPRRHREHPERPLNPVGEKMPDALKLLRQSDEKPPADGQQDAQQRRLQMVRRELERRRKEKEAEEERRRQQDLLLWEAEKARLDAMDRNRPRSDPGDWKPSPPRIVSRSVHSRQQEGYWRAELVRIADTDTETLQKQKQTGLDKLVPPLDPTAPSSETSGKSRQTHTPPRDEEADRALFEAEMKRLQEEGHAPKY
ncbi:MAG: Smr/MutS family protein [Chloroherpetonaceae bacterium]|nr:Smr/MutS family protein [Chthonomonadaceae bacterium]MDW8206240.1 Smr/MutS family protein [Chloroherpetonaceae bacterium]